MSSQPTSNAPVLHVQGLGFGFPGHSLFQDWSADFPAGLSLIQGGDGTGKTSLLRLFAGESAPQAGSVTLLGMDAVRQPAEYRAQVFWRDPRAPWPDTLTPLTWVEQLPAHHPRWSGEAWRAHVAGFGLAMHLHKPMYQLSSGSQRKVLLAAALASGAVLTFELQANDETRALWPHDFTLYARFKLGKTCEIELEAHGEFETTSALHTYFNVGDINAVKVSGLGDTFIDKVDNAKEGKLSDGVQTFPDRTDRVYLHPEACSVIHDGALNRGIEVVHHHHSDVVGWNPGPALSVSMADVPDDGYKTFVCVETACVTAPQKASEEKPSRLGQTIRIVKR